MLILTDAPDRTEEWTASLIGPATVKPSFGPPSPWWRELGGDLAPLAVEGPAREGLANWPLVIAVADAPRSQFDVLVAAARAPGALTGPVVALALTGRGFHGNRGRAWRAEPGNLHLSVALPLDLPAASCAPVLPGLVAVAVVEALAQVCGPGLGAAIKWVNDILIGGAKVGGVLAASQLRGANLTALILGVGLNVRTAPRVPPTAFVPQVACLADHAAGAVVAASPSVLVAAVLRALADQLARLAAAGPGPIAQDYRRHCRDVGRRVAVWPEGVADGDRSALPPPLFEGTVASLGPDLALRLEGRDDPFISGRLAYLDHHDR